MGMSTAILVLSVTLLITSWIFSLISFAILVRMMWKKNEMKSGSNLMLLNLSVVDAMFTSYCFPFLIYVIINSTCMQPSGLCMAFISGLLSLGTCHLLTVVMIIIRRYLSDTCNRPGVLSSLDCLFDISYHQTKSYVLPVIWVCAFSANIPVLTGLFQLQCKESQVQCFFVHSTSSQIYAVVYCVIFFTLPLVFMIVFQAIWYFSRIPTLKEDQEAPRIITTKGQKSSCGSTTGNYTDILGEAIRRNGVRPFSSRKEKQGGPKFFVVKNKVPDKPSGCRSGRTVSTVFILFVVTTVTWCPYFAVAIKDTNNTSIPCEDSSGHSERVELTTTTEVLQNCSQSTQDESEATLLAFLLFLPNIGPLLRFAVYTGKMSRFRSVVVVFLGVISSAVGSLVICFTPKLNAQSKLRFYRSVLRRRVHPDLRYSPKFHSSQVSRTGITREWRDHQPRPESISVVKSGTTAEKCHNIQTVSQAIHHNRAMQADEHFNFITSWAISRESNDPSEREKCTIDVTTRDGPALRTYGGDIVIIVDRPSHDVSAIESTLRSSDIDDSALFGAVR